MIYGVKTINWGDFSWKHLSLNGDETVISLLAQKGLRILRFCIVSWKDEREPSIKKSHGKTRLAWFKSSPEYRTLDRIDAEPIEFEWNIFPGFTTLQLCNKVQELMSIERINKNNSKDGSSSYRCSMTSYGELQTMNRTVLLTPHLCPYLQKDFHQDFGHSSDLDQRKSCVLSVNIVHKVNGTKWRKR